MASAAGNIQFDYFKTTYRLRNPRRTSNWIRRVIKSEKGKLSSLSYVFCSDAYLLKINQDFLDHDTFTDIITFDYSEAPGLEGEIYVSVQRVRENARSLKVDFEMELHRVIIHGVLHLLGYSDKSEKGRKEMREREEAALKRLD